MAIENKWVLQSQTQHFLPGVTEEMLDWVWANMEKGYYLGAPGSHKRFNWVKEPWRVGFEHSAHMISESVGEGAAVFGIFDDENAARSAVAALKNGYKQVYLCKPTHGGPRVTVRRLFGAKK